MLSCDILIKKRRFILFPKGGVFLFEFFQNGFHNGLTQEFRLVFYAVTVTIDPQGPYFSVVKHKGKTICPS